MGGGEKFLGCWGRSTLALYMIAPPTQPPTLGGAELGPLTRSYAGTNCLREQTPEGDWTRGARREGLDRIPVSVKKSLLRKRRRVGKSALRAPNLGLDCSFCCWTARPRLKRHPA